MNQQTVATNAAHSRQRMNRKRNSSLYSQGVDVL